MSTQKTGGNPGRRERQDEERDPREIGKRSSPNGHREDDRDEQEQESRSLHDWPVAGAVYD